jgi:hypothetical protein
MSAQLLNPRASLLALLGDLRYTLSRIKADPLATSLLSVFEGLRDQWAAVQAKEIENQEELSDAQAAVDIADIHLAAFVSRISRAVLTLVKDDRNHPLYLHFFGDKDPSVFAEGKSGIEFQEMRPWLSSVARSPDPSLEAMAAELGLRIIAADKAIQARDAVKARIRTFCDSGARRQLFDQCNEARGAAHEVLARIGRETADSATDYASGFFRSDAGEPMPSEPPSAPLVSPAGDLGAKVAAARVQLEKLEKLELAAESEAARAREELGA